nr:unnamed protein product [Callosobruchus chinensis]
MMSFMIPFYAERGQKSNLEQSEVVEQRSERLNNSDDEVDADAVNDNAMNNSPRHPSDNNTIHSQVTPYSRESSKCNRQQQSTPMAKVLKDYFEEKQISKLNKKADHLQKFFDAMQETVRTFSPRLQIEIKSKISNIVSEYELKVLLSKQVPNVPQINDSQFRKVQSNVVPYVSTESESDDPLNPSGSENYQTPFQRNFPPSSSTQSSFSRSPLLSPGSENNYSVQMQDQLSSTNENYGMQWQDQSNGPWLSSRAAPHSSLENSRVSSRFPSSVTKEKSNSNNYQEL